MAVFRLQHQVETEQRAFIKTVRLKVARFSEPKACGVKRFTSGNITRVEYVTSVRYQLGELSDIVAPKNYPSIEAGRFLEFPLRQCPARI